MKKTLLFLFLIPIVFFGYTINENRYFITRDQGFFKTYRTMGAFAKDTTGKGIIWVEETRIPPKFLVADLINKRLWYKEGRTDEDNIYSFTKTFPVGSYTLGTFPSTLLGLSLYDAYIQHVSTTTTARILLSTSDGVYMSTNGGNTWVAQQTNILKSQILSVCASPVYLENSALNMTMMYALWNNGVLFRRTSFATSYWSKFGDIRYDFEDMNTKGTDTLVPPDWSRVGDDSNYVGLTNSHAKYDTIISNVYVVRDDTLGLHGYSLKIYANDSTGTYYARYPFTDTLERKIIEFYVYLDSLPSVPEYTSGIISIINDGKKIELLITNTGFSPLNNVDKVIDELKVNKWNRISVWCDFVKGIATIYGEKKTYTIPLVGDTTLRNIREMRLEAPISKGYSFYVDDISIRPWIYDLVGHKNIKGDVYASTSDGIFLFDSSSASWVKEYHYKGYPQFLVSDPDGNYYAFLDPESKKVYFKETGWTDVTNNLPTNCEYYDINIDRLGNIYLGSSNYVYRLIKGGTDWVNLSNGFNSYGMIDYVKEIRNLAVVNPETIYVANENGVYGTFDAGANWFQDNDANIEPSLAILTPTFIDSLNNAFEDTLSGIYKIVSTYIGIPPDVDKDSSINLILMDILDTLGDGTSGSVCSYWSSVNQTIFDSVSYPYSNHAEIIYIDYRNLKNKFQVTKDSILANLTEMVSWWNDKAEELWHNNIFQAQTYHKYNYDTLSNNTPITFDFQIGDWRSGTTTLKSPFNYSTVDAIVTKQTYAYTMFLTNLYGDNVIKELLKNKGYKIVDPMIGRRDSIDLHGVESLDTLLIKKGSSFKATFLDFVKTIILNSIPKLTNLSFLSTPCSTAVYWRTLRGPVDPTCGQFYLTPRVIRFEPYYLTLYGKNSVRFNGSNSNDFVIMVSKEKSGIIDTSFSYYYLDGSENPNRLLDIDLSSLGDGSADNIYVSVVSVSTKGTDANNVKYFFTHITERDTTIKTGIIRSPISERYARLFLYSRKKLYKDVDIEKPVFSMGDKRLEMAFFDTLMNGSRIYTCDFVIPSTAQNIILTSEDKAGNEYAETLFVYNEEVGSSGGLFEISGYNIYIPEGAYTGKFTTITSRNSIFISSDFVKPVILKLPIPEGIEKPTCLKMSKPDVYEDVGGVKIGDVIQVSITKGGTYIVGDGNNLREISIKTGIVLPSSINPSSFEFAIERQSNVEISLYDITGRKIENLLEGEFKAGVYPIENMNMRKLPKGILFIVMKTDFGCFSKKLINLR